MGELISFFVLIALIVFIITRIGSFVTLRGLRKDLQDIRVRVEALPREFEWQQTLRKKREDLAEKETQPAPSPVAPPPPMEPKIEPKAEPKVEPKVEAPPTSPVSSATVTPPVLTPQERAAALARAFERPIEPWSEPTPEPTPEPRAESPTPPPRSITPRSAVSVPVPTPRKESEFERRARESLAKIWSWIIVGEEFRPNSVAVEYAVATVWLVRSAVLLTLLGLGFLVKYSHDRNLVSPELRIAGIILGGLAILALGYKLSQSKKYRLLGLGFSGVGVVTLYFSIFAATSLYGLIAGAVAFPLMILITVFAALLALRQNALLVALIAVIGGYATPVMLSTGAKHMPEFFAYLLLIGGGSLFLAFYRNWRLLNIVAFVFNYVLFGTAIYKYFDPKLMEDYWTVIGFGGAYFVLFGLLPLCYSLIHRVKITLIETLLLFGNTAIFFYYGISATQQALPGTRYAAGVAVFAALVFAIELFFCFRFKVRDRNLYLTILTLCTFSVSLSLPLLLSSSWLSAAWAIQAAVMLYLGVHSRSRVLTLFSYGLYFVAGFHTLQVLGHNLDGEYYAGLLTRLVSLGGYSISLVAGCWIMKRAERGAASGVIAENEPELARIESPVIAEILLFAGAILGFFLFRIEIAQLPVTVPTLRLLLCSFLYLGAIVFLLQRHRVQKNIALLHCMGIMMFVGLFDLSRIALLARYEDYYPLSAFRVAGFLVFVLGLAWITRLLFQRRNGRVTARTFGITAGILWFLYSSLELFRGLTLKLPDFAQGGLSMLWAVYALALLVAGIAYRIKPLRMTGLSLFAVVALKALLIDMSRAGALYRIIAFFAVGLLLFVGAFAYMRMEQMFRKQEKSKDE